MKLNIVLETQQIEDVMDISDPIHSILNGTQDYIDSNIVLDTDGPNECWLCIAADACASPVVIREKLKQIVDMICSPEMLDTKGAIMAPTMKELDLDRAFSLSHSTFISEAVCEMIRCKTFPTMPRKLDIIIQKLTELYEREFAEFMEASWCKVCKNYETACRPKDVIQCAFAFAYLIRFAQDNGLSIAEAHEHPMVKAHLEALKIGFLNPLA